MSSPLARTRLLPYLLFLLLLVGIMTAIALLLHSQEHPFDLVEEGLYLGESVERPPPGTKAVLNVCGRKDPYRVEAELWLPVLEDDQEPTLDWLTRSVDFITEQRRQGRPVFIHCLAGMNRSGTVVVAYLMRKYGWNPETALKHLQQKRPIVQPNPTLMRLLAAWQKAG